MPGIVWLGREDVATFTAVPSDEQILSSPNSLTRTTATLSTAPRKMRDEIAQNVLPRARRDDKRVAALFREGSTPPSVKRASEMGPYFWEAVLRRSPRRCRQTRWCRRPRVDNPRKCRRPGGLRCRFRCRSWCANTAFPNTCFRRTPARKSP